MFANASSVSSTARIPSAMSPAGVAEHHVADDHADEDRGGGPAKRQSRDEEGRDDREQERDAEIRPQHRRVDGGELAETLGNRIDAPFGDVTESPALLGLHRASLRRS